MEQWIGGHPPWAVGVPTFDPRAAPTRTTAHRHRRPALRGRPRATIDGPASGGYAAGVTHRRPRPHWPALVAAALGALGETPIRQDGRDASSGRRSAHDGPGTLPPALGVGVLQPIGHARLGRPDELGGHRTGLHDALAVNGSPTGVDPWGQPCGQATARKVTMRRTVGPGSDGRSSGDGLSYQVTVPILRACPVTGGPMTSRFSTC